jgi:crotonobetainyl-CoA:carnitine CoA-transferase CaiB-like acyl-CoA transferase
MDARWLAVGALEAKFWRALCAALGRDDLVGGQFAAGIEGTRVRAELEAVFATDTLAGWTTRLAGIDCCVSPVLTFDEALVDAQFRARGVVVTGPDGSRQYAPPFRLDPPASTAVRNAPRQGEHSREILAEAGLPDAAIDALIADGVVSAAS